MIFLSSDSTFPSEDTPGVVKSGCSAIWPSMPAADGTSVVTKEHCTELLLCSPRDRFLIASTAKPCLRLPATILRLLDWRCARLRVPRPAQPPQGGSDRATCSPSCPSSHSALRCLFPGDTLQRACLLPATAGRPSDALS